MRFPLVIVACLLLTLSAPAQEKTQEIAQPKKPATALNADAATCEARSRKLWADFKNRNRTALAATLAEGFRALEEGGDGFVDAKGYLTAFDGFELKNYTLSDYVITPLGPGAALVNYHARYDGVAAGETTQGNAGFSEIWVRHGGNWKLQYLQETYVK